MGSEDDAHPAPGQQMSLASLRQTEQKRCARAGGLPAESPPARGGRWRLSGAHALLLRPRSLRPTLPHHLGEPLSRDAFSASELRVRIGQPVHRCDIAHDLQRFLQSLEIFRSDQDGRGPAVYRHRHLLVMAVNDSQARRDETSRLLAAARSTAAEAKGAPRPCDPLPMFATINEQRVVRKYPRTTGASLPV